MPLEPLSPEIAIDAQAPGRLEITNLSKKFKGREVVRNLSLNVEPGERIAIIGPSGCGKSTLLRLMMALQPADKGRILVDNQDITQCSIKEIRHIRKRFGLLFQSAALFDSLNVAENIAFPLIETLGETDHKKIAHHVHEVLELVEMKEARHKMPSELSGGQRKRVGLARAIISRPQFILYDEPTTGLDPVLSTSIEDLIVKLSYQMKVTSIVVTHQISTILRTADKIYLMHEGELLHPETPASIRTATNQYGEFLKGNV